MGKVKIFCCYALEDVRLAERLRAHLRGLEPFDVDASYAHDTSGGVVWEDEHRRQLNAADIILLLMSADYINSPHYDKDVEIALSRDERGEVTVLPVILRPVMWRDTPLGRFVPLPDKGLAVTDEKWHTRDHAFFNIVTGIKRVIQTRNPLVGGESEEARAAGDKGQVGIERIIRSFKELRGQLGDRVIPGRPKRITIEIGEIQYNTLYGDTMVFLATYLPQTIAEGSGSFAEAVYTMWQEALRKRRDPYVAFVRFVLQDLAA